jgi:hypothetical protein
MNRAELRTQLKQVGGAISLAVLAFLATPAGDALASFLKETVSHDPPYTKHEVEIINQIGAASDACSTDPSGQACMTAYNKCNGNAQRPKDQQTTGCFAGLTPIYGADGKTINAVVTELTNYSWSIPVGKDSSQAVYTPIGYSNVRATQYRENRNLFRGSGNRVFSR